MRSGVKTALRLLDSEARQSWKFGGYYFAFVTLTFAASEEFRADRISAFIHRVRSWYGRRGVSFRYTWVAELTKRGRLHYHALFALPNGLTLPKPDKRGWWPYGSSRIERARHAVAYLAKYASKGGSVRDAYPKGARIYGAGGLSAPAADEKRWWLSPKWVREGCEIEDRPFRASGGGFVLRATGEILSSPWAVVAVAGGFVRLAYIGELP